MGFWDKVKHLVGAGDKPAEDEKKDEEAKAPAPSQKPPATKSAAPAARSAPPAKSAPPAATSAPAGGSSTGRGRPAPAPAARAASPAAAAAPAQAPVRKRSSDDPLEANEILGLSQAEMRKRALKIDPYRTAWIGRVDTIPPQNDERTALIDRGLILRGLLTEEQITEIHRIGDLWLTHHDAAKLAKAAAAKSMEAAIEQLRREREERKAKRKAEAAERKARRREEIARRKAEDIVFLGPGVSHLLSDRRSHVEELEARGLPVLSTPADVARALGLPVARLRWCASTPRPRTSPIIATSRCPSAPAARACSRPRSPSWPARSSGSSRTSSPGWRRRSRRTAS